MRKEEEVCRRTDALSMLEHIKRKIAETRSGHKIVRKRIRDASSSDDDNTGPSHDRSKTPPPPPPECSSKPEPPTPTHYENLSFWVYDALRTHGVRSSVDKADVYRRVHRVMQMLCLPGIVFCAVPVDDGTYHAVWVASVERCEVQRIAENIALDMHDCEAAAELRTLPVAAESRTLPVAAEPPPVARPPHDSRPAFRPLQMRDALWALVRAARSMAQLADLRERLEAFAADMLLHPPAQLPTLVARLMAVDTEAVQRWDSLLCMERERCVGALVSSVPCLSMHVLLCCLAGGSLGRVSFLTTCLAEVPWLTGGALRCPPCGERKRCRGYSETSLYDVRAVAAGLALLRCGDDRLWEAVSARFGNDF